MQLFPVVVYLSYETLGVFGKYEAGIWRRRRARCQKIHDLRQQMRLAAEHCGVHRCPLRLHSTCTQHPLNTGTYVMKTERRTMHRMYTTWEQQSRDAGNTLFTCPVRWHEPHNAGTSCTVTPLHKFDRASWWRQDIR